MLEEIYYFEVADGPAGPGIGYQRVYGHPGKEIDVLAEVRSGDVVLIPFGWHGPSIAVPGYDLYYLNVMAGPGDERAWRICDDPAHGWVRDTWADQAVDPRLPFGGPTGGGPMSVRLTVAQAIVRFLEVQYVERDGVETPFFAGCWGIFGHGNVAGVGQALLEREHAENAGEAGAEHVLRYHQARNEQAMVHAAVGYARHRDRLAAFACSASVGPGSTNMVTGAALATINRIPVLLLPGDVFATRVSNPVLQEVEDPRSLRRQRQRLLQAGLALLGPDQPARAAPAVAAGGRCACSPTPPRPARSPCRCRRTCRPRPGTGRTTCSPAGCGTCPASPSR